MLPPRLVKKPKRSSRWRSQKHTRFVTSFACCACHSQVNIQAAHVRLGSGTGMGQKPDDWRVLPLCGGTGYDGQIMGCHNRQHIVGEETFWRSAKINPEELISAFIKASPCRREIEAVMREREA